MTPRVGLALALTTSIAASAWLVPLASAQPAPPPPAADGAGRAVPPPPREQRGERGPRRDEARPRASNEDRAAFLDARIASVHAGLRLNADQEKLWGPIETAVRDGFARLSEQREKARTAGRPSDPVDGLRRTAEASLNRGEALKKIADAAQPLYATLSDDQKRRLPLLVNAGRSRFGDMRERMMREFGDQRPRQGMMGRGRGGDRFGPPPGGDEN